MDNQPIRNCDDASPLGVAAPDPPPSADGSPPREAVAVTQAIKVLFVDDDPRLRSAWQKLLTLQAGIHLVGTLDCADEISRRVSESGAAVVLLDLTMPGADPLHAIEQLGRECPNARVIVYSGYNDRRTVQQTIDAGAWGFVNKTDAPQEILAAIRRVADGDVVLPAGF